MIASDVDTIAQAATGIVFLVVCLTAFLFMFFGDEILEHRREMTKIKYGDKEAKDK